MSARKHKKHSNINIVNNTVENRIHQVFPEVDVPQIVEPNPVCSICGESISAIIEAIKEEDGSYSHFDCVIEKLKKQYNVQEPDKISYVGHGCFAVVSKNEDGTFFFKERIQYENNETYAAMKQFVEDSKKNG